MPNDNTKTSNTSQTNDVPQVFSEDVLPPMPQNNGVNSTAPTTNTTPSNEVKVDTAVEQKTETNDSGSAAPSNDINLPPVVMGTTPKKKFGSGKVIATILGLFLLVGGLGAGTYLVQQNQNIEERAGACGGGCGPGMQCAGDLDNDGVGECVPRGTTDEEIDNALNGGGGLDNIGGVESTINTNGTYNTTGTTNQTSWNEWQNEQQGVGQLNTGCTAPTGLEFLCGTACNSNEPGVACLSSAPGNLPAGYTIQGPNSGGRYTISGPGCGGICGEYRIQTSTGGGGGGGGGGGNNPTPTPPVFTAVCQSVKAYSTSGNNEVPLTQTQLSALRSGDVINLCVQGQKSGGTFTKMRWTINGSLQAEEAITDNTGTTNEGRYCRAYTIPATLPNNGAFTFKAELYHSTLGWK